jgi:acetylglutamate kinase
VSLINQKGGKAVGLSGKTANLFTAKKIKGKNNQDLGQVGNIDNLNMDLINLLCEQGYIPVISSVGISDQGESLNMNADHVAMEIAKALKSLKLIYLTDVEGILKQGELISFLDLAAAKYLSKDDEIKGGMIPKLGCSIEAIENDVSQVHIINGLIEHSVLLEIFTDVGIGTMIAKEKR